MQEQSQTRKAINAGITFAVILIFLALIGFTFTGAELLGDIVGLDVQLRQRQMPSRDTITAYAMFVGIIGLWMGLRAGRPDPERSDTWVRAALLGVLAGIVAGVIFGLFLILVGTFAFNGVDLRKQLVAMSVEAVAMLTFGQAPIVGAAIGTGLLAVTGAIGGLLGRGIGRGAWRESVSAWRERATDWYQGLPITRQIRRSRISEVILYAVLIGVVLFLPTILSSYWNYNLGTVGIYVLLGLGLNIVVGMAGLLDLGYVAFFAIGAYTVALLTAPQPHALNWSFWAALPVGIVLAMISGILLGIPVLRLRGDYLAIVTLGFGEIIRILSRSDLLTSFTGGPRGVRNVAGPMLFGTPFNNERQFMYLIIAGCLILIFVTSRLQSSRVGRAWMVMREDETVARAMGINTWKYKLLAFAIGAAFAGLGGVLFASRNQFTGPEDHNLLVSINVLALVIVGGMGSIPGVIFGALALKGLPEVLRELDTFRMLAFGALLVAMMVLRPEGIWPSKRRRLELELHEEAAAIEEALPERLTPTPGGEST